ncbi:MAG TPA: hypothetical protein VFO29_01605 [Candidatus Rubrimentiphilum sp.]|nr:hypothetical protein [Candidatus Rubrimentiphilum sp.]
MEDEYKHGALFFVRNGVVIVCRNLRSLRAVEVVHGVFHDKFSFAHAAAAKQLAVIDDQFIDVVDEFWLWDAVAGFINVGRNEQYGASGYPGGRRSSLERDRGRGIQYRSRNELCLADADSGPDEQAWARNTDPAASERANCRRQKVCRKSSATSSGDACPGTILQPKLSR